MNASLYRSIRAPDPFLFPSRGGALPSPTRGLAPGYRLAGLQPAVLHTKRGASGVFASERKSLTHSCSESFRDWPSILPIFSLASSRDLPFLLNTLEAVTTNPENAVATKGRGRFAARSCIRI